MLDSIAANEVGLDDMGETFETMMKGEMRGRTVVKVGT